MDWHTKPPKDIRSVDDAMKAAEQKREELPQVVQVLPSDWDNIILYDEIIRLRNYLAMILGRD